jgi:cytochrome P450
MAWFVLAMVLYPDIQKRAQEEIDSVIGLDRPPTFKDYDRLPYVGAIVKEILRWRGVSPIGTFR